MVNVSVATKFIILLHFLFTCLTPPDHKKKGRTTDCMQAQLGSGTCSAGPGAPPGKSLSLVPLIVL